MRTRQSSQGTHIQGWRRWSEGSFTRHAEVWMDHGYQGVTREQVHSLDSQKIRERMWDKQHSAWRGKSERGCDQRQPGAMTTVRKENTQCCLLCLSPQIQDVVDHYQYSYLLPSVGSALDQPPSYKIDTPSILFYFILFSSILDKRKMVRNQWCRQCQTAKKTQPLLTRCLCNQHPRHEKLKEQKLSKMVGNNV